MIKIKTTEEVVFCLAYEQLTFYDGWAILEYYDIGSRLVVGTAIKGQIITISHY